MTDDEDTPSSTVVLRLPPRWMTDQQLRKHFGLSERALRVCRTMHGFPPRNVLLNRTDSKLVDKFFDRMSGLCSPVDDFDVVDGEENLDA